MDLQKKYLSQLILNSSLLNCLLKKPVIVLTNILIILAFVPTISFAASDITLDQATPITDGIRLCDVNNSYCVNITRNSGSTETVRFTTAPRIGNGGGVSNTELIILDYDTSTSPNPFNLEEFNINQINSLSSGNSVNSVRDAYSWSKPGEWEILGTGGSASPAGAIVSIDTAAPNNVGSFIINDPDGGNNTNLINQFSILPSDASDVLLNMTGAFNGHNVIYTLDTPTSNVSMYVFNSGAGGMGWNFSPSMTVSIPDLALFKTVINDDGGTAVPADWTLEANIGGGTSEISGTDGVTGTSLAIGDYDLSEMAGPANYTLTSLSCSNSNTGAGATDVSGVSLANPIVSVAIGDGISCEFVNDDDDVTAPLVTTTSAPIASAFNQLTYPVSGTCTIDDGPVTVAIAGATPASQAVTCSASGTWDATFDVSAIADGADVIDVNASQTDTSGNIGTATLVEANKDTFPPAITNAPTANAANQGTYVVSGVCSPLINIITVDIAGANPTSQDVACVDPGNGDPGTWTATFDVSNITDGTDAIDITASQTDGTTTVPVVPLAVDKDTTPPAVSTSIPPTATLANENMYPVNGMCTVGDGNVTVTIAGASPASQAVACSAAGTWEVIFDVSGTGIADGLNVIDVNASQTDLAGNNATAALVEANKDTTAPVVVIDTPPVATTNNQDSFPVSGTCTPDDGNVTVNITGGNVTLFEQSVPCSPTGTWSTTFDVSGLADGTDALDITANQTDVNGNTGIATTVEADKDSTPPTLTVTAGDDTNDSTPTITGTSDEIGGIVNLTITDSEGQIQTITAIVQPDGTFSVDVPNPLAVGPFTVEATITDTDGNLINAAAAPASILATPVPTLSEWALILLMMLLGIIVHRQGLIKKTNL